MIQGPKGRTPNAQPLRASRVRPIPVPPRNTPTTTTTAIMPPRPATPTIDALLNLVPDSPSTVLSHLAAHPALASARDAHGYSLLHAAASYGQLALLRALVRDHGAAPDLVDEDAETALFAAESVAVARCLVEELGADAARRNADGLTAADKIEAEDEWPLVAAYLRARAGGGDGAAADGEGAVQGGQAGAQHPPPLPDGVKINVGTMEEPADEEQMPDPEFRRRIEELAAREDFRGEEGQRELRNLIVEAVSGLTLEGQGREARRRVE